jgi:dienelactone hydrolase
MKAARTRLSVTVALLAACQVSALAQTAAPARVRAAFLELLDRPRVALAAESRPRPDSGSYTAENFTFASEAGERVPGIFLKSVGSKDRRPVVIFLHGAGTRKEGQLPLMRTLADRGFAAVSIDARHHGERIASGTDLDQYYDAMLRTYRTGKGRPYLYDTVWDVMRLIDYLEARPDVDSTRIGVMGISKGGTEAYLAAAADARISVVVPIIGVQSFRWALDNDRWQPRVGTFSRPVEAAARDEGIARIDAAFVRRFYDRVVPGIYGDLDAPSVLRLIAPRPMLVINGDSDPRTPLAGVEASVAAARDVYRGMGADDKLGVYLQPNAGHVFTPVAELVMADWFAKWLIAVGR